MNVVQKVVSPLEKMALKIAELHTAERETRARQLMGELTLQHWLTFAERNALAHVTACMLHGEKWKKD